MKELILELMEQTLSAYTDEAIREYFDRVQTEGLTEHGFPRLASDIGILIAHGRRKDLLPIFIQMFEFCCRTIPKVKAHNDFSVREVICCLWEVEKKRGRSQRDRGALAQSSGNHRTGRMLQQIRRCLG
ncbi:MAG: hypothetical protein IKJ74_05105 [Clostridia bacterium]|nr:hypothetical protein [Clostridia bacterium]